MVQDGVVKLPTCHLVAMKRTNRLGLTAMQGWMFPLEQEGVWELQ